MSSMSALRFDPEKVTDIQHGSLLNEAFLAAQGQGAYESLGAFTVFCMSNGSSSNPDDLWHKDASFERPRLVDLNNVRRTVGVGLKTEINEEPCDFYGNIERIEHRILGGFQPPPLVVERRQDGWMYLLDGNHTKFALQKRLKVPRYWVIEAQT